MAISINGCFLLKKAENPIKNQPIIEQNQNISIQNNNSFFHPTSKLLKTYYIPFTSRVTNVYHGQLPEGLSDKVDNFEETHQNALFLGEGLFSKAYKLNGTNYVIKESLSTPAAKRVNGTFSQEASMLSSLPSSLKNTQKLVANVKTEKGNHYLLSTLVEGEKPEPPASLWKLSHFNSLFNNLFALDEANIYHGDLNRGNCLIDNKGNVNLLDYQYAEKFNINDSTANDSKFKFPAFMMPSNAQMFEMANLPFYITNLATTNQRNNIKDCFKTYLNSKSNYCGERAELLRYSKGNKDSIRYEQLQEYYYKNPSDDMINLQAEKLQVLYAFRQAFSMTDKNNALETNIISAVPCYLYTAACAKKFVDSAEKLKNRNTNDKKLNEFLDFEIKYGEYWKSKMLRELSGEDIHPSEEYGTFKWVVRNAKLDPHWKGGKVDPDDDLSQRFKTSSTKDFDTIKDVAVLITGKNNLKSKDSYTWGLYGVKEPIYNLDQKIREGAKNQVPNNSSYNRGIAKVNILKNNFIGSFNETFNALDQQRIIACVPASIRALHNAALLKKEADTLYEKSSSSPVYNYARMQKELADNAFNTLSELTPQLYKRAIDAIKGNDKNLEEALYYEKLNEFDMKNCPQYNTNKPLIFKNDL